MDDGLMRRMTRFMESLSVNRHYMTGQTCMEVQNDLRALLAQQSEIASLRGALKPFADLVAEHGGESVDTLVPVKLYHLCIALGALTVNTMG